MNDSTTDFITHCALLGIEIDFNKLILLATVYLQNAIAKLSTDSIVYLAHILFF